MRATAQDWAALKNSRPEEYRGTTAFARMNACERLRWLDLAVAFVNRSRSQANPPPQRVAHSS
jgi:hypothetical protein